MLSFVLVFCSIGFGFLLGFLLGGGDFHIEWRIIGHAPAYNPITRKCSLCTIEKLYIAEHINENLLNKRDELVSKCRHRRKYSFEICQ